MDKSLYGKAVEYFSTGKRGALVTIIEKAGPAPREKGAKMFVGNDGQSFGTIGGGLVEAEAIEVARQVLETGKMRRLQVRMNAREVESEGMLCGGDVDILIEPLHESMISLYEEICRHEGKDRKGVVVTALAGDMPEKSLISGTGGDVYGAPLSVERAEMFLSLRSGPGPLVSHGYLIEPLMQGSKLFIFGAGHVSQYVSRIAHMVGFSVTIIDDREEFANKSRFPEAHQVVVSPFDETFTSLDFNGDVYIVIVTRGHSHDALVLEKSLKVGARYIGMIGSKRKVAIVFDHLGKKGVRPEELKDVYAPIGLSINSETPEEIGVSIVAQLIKVRGEN